jgi:uracil-DNA glycosylase family 4
MSTSGSKAVELCELYERMKNDPWDGLRVQGTPENERFVGGTGEIHGEARFVIIGEAPGREEAELGAPFVGKSGQLLNAALAAAEVKRSECWITNVVKWRPPGNITPDTYTVDSNRAYLSQELRIIGCPRIILLGGTAYSVGRFDISYTSARLGWFQRGPWWFHAQFHPAYVLRGGITKEAYFQNFRRMVQAAEEAVT